jgi:hypothetical protein
MKIEYFVSAVLLLAYVGACYFLFYRQAMNAYANSMVGNGPYYSDVLAYIQQAMGYRSGYTFTYPVYFNMIAFCSLFLPVEVSTALVTTLLCGGSVVLVAYYGRRFLGSAGVRGSAAGGADRASAGVLLPFLMALSLHLISMLYLPTGQWHLNLNTRYIGVFTPNPYHNATYLAVRCISIPAFFLFVELLESYEREFSLKKGIWFGFWLLMTALTKPSFTIIMVAACGLWMAWRLIREKFRNFAGTLRLGCCFIPTFVVLLTQFMGTFGEQTESGSDAVSSLYRSLTGIMPLTGELGVTVAERYPEYLGTGMNFGFLDAWKIVCGNIPVAILLAGAFPLAAVVVPAFENWAAKQRGEAGSRVDLEPGSDVQGHAFGAAFGRNLLNFSTLFYLCGLASFVFLYERGERFIHLNFSWGYMHGLFTLSMAGLFLLVKGTVRHKLGRAILWILYAAHLICGIGYFVYLLMGGNYQSF